MSADWSCQAVAEILQGELQLHQIPLQLRAVQRMLEILSEDPQVLAVSLSEILQ